MPKKTKRQKIIAAYRKKIKLTTGVSPVAAPIQVNPKVTTSIKETPKENEKISENSFFFSDLKKSLILVGVVIALEIALYFARIIK